MRSCWPPASGSTMGWWPSMSGCRWRQRTDCMASLPRPGLLWSRRWQRPRRMASGCRWPKITAIWPRCWRRAAGAVPSRWWSGRSLWGSGTEARRAQLNSSADRPAIAAALTEKELALARAGGPAPHQQGDRRNTPPLGGNGQAVHQPAVRQAGHRRGRAKQARPAGCPFWHKILTKG